MKPVTSRTLAIVLTAAFLATQLATQTPLPAGAANGHDDPGTRITNGASATYKDGNNNTYTTTSNTLTITVQTAPSLANTPGTSGNYAPNQFVTDTYVLLNSGNGSGYFQLAGDATLGGTDSGYATLGNGSATCTTPAGSQSSPCLYAATVGSTTYSFTNLSTSGDNNALNYWLQHTNPLTVANATVTLSVYYTLSGSAPTNSSNTVSSTTIADVVYAAAGSATAETSANQTATQSNAVKPEARVDLYEQSAQNNTTGEITYTVYAHNGGSFSGKDLLSAQTLVGASTPGILFSEKVPVFNGSTLALASAGTVATTSTALYGYPTGATLDVYYSPSATGAPGRGPKAAGNLPTNGSVTYIGIYVHGGSCASSGFDLCADPTHATIPGSISVLSSSALTFSFVTVEPSGTGAGQPGAITALANGMVGDNAPTEHILGPGIAATTADSASGSALTASGQGINNTALIAVPGASNLVANQALGSYFVDLGPLGDPTSQGSYDGTAAVNGNDNFTAASFGNPGDAIVNTSTVPGTPTSTSTTGASVSVCVGATLVNGGNLADTFNVTLYAPTNFTIPTAGGQSYSGSFSAGGTQASGWSVALYSDSGCTSLMGGSSRGGVSSTASHISLASGATANLYAGYVIPAGTRYFTRFDSLLYAVSNGQPTQYSVSHVELYSSILAITFSSTVTSTNCPAGVTPAYVAGTVCPGDSIAYIVDARNVVLGQSDTNVSFAATVADTSSFADVDDGTLSSNPASTTTNNWGYFTTGLQAPPIAYNSTGVVVPLLLEYGYGTPRGTFTPTFTPGATAFEVAPVAGGELVPHHYNSPGSTQDWQSTVTFTLTVK